MSQSRGRMTGGGEPTMDILKNWMLEKWQRKVDGALIDDVKVMQDTDLLSPIASDSVRGSECDVHQDITNQDLVHAEATTLLNMSFYRDSSS